MTKPFAISGGDPAGIGPEIICKSWLERQKYGLQPFFVVGNFLDFEGNSDVPTVKISEPAEALSKFETALPVFHIHEGDPAVAGQPSLDGAQCALHALEIAVGLARSGDAAAIITAPVSKSQLYQVGFRYPGQTEFVSERCGIARENAVMMLAGPSLRVIPMTTHIALKAVPPLLTQELITARAEAARKAMIRNFGILQPRIAVAGLNPHAGEDGNLGTEEKTVMEPAIQRLRKDGLDISGPLPADTMFHAEARSRYDVALCPYHDQALVPLKTLHFFDGVNMTLGLPIVRTSPDHGTAFEIAGQNKADPRSMIAAIQMAATAVENRKEHDHRVRF
ncbi:4-hydroxythreonine-4-phosphate dehydrogenase [Parasphingorhabdus marina DSM 22363]|uniref:4-hydroxythreonine-4-phosphate dehydrogenase n=1 Tax=Parasphingorhabdus marina DSM 22363 TaxID=1123272 RepID=A0A1N6GI50_9SPHN|nr:4-hydroxythreonine-4-phosphate dehydrogenase PdxA [Parasphingorhabdus marina]SIO07186.1 4-hydroxythreonine-4-phosphate dehydrogenase [Parasphingorhabdus marina DSM 22363]